MQTKTQSKASQAAAHDKFVKISHAYKVLSDPEQREIYDRDGHGGMKKLEGHPMHPGQINPFMLLNMLLGTQHLLLSPHPTPIPEPNLDFQAAYLCGSLERPMQR